MRLYSVLPSFFFFFFVSATFETQRGTYSSILFFSHLTCTLQRHKLVTAKMFSMFSVGGAYMNINEFPDMCVELRISVHAPCASAGLMEYFKKGNIFSVVQTYA